MIFTLHWVFWNKILVGRYLKIDKSGHEKWKYMGMGNKKRKPGEIKLGRIQIKVELKMFLSKKIWIKKNYLMYNFYSSCSEIDNLPLKFKIDVS